VEEMNKETTRNEYLSLLPKYDRLGMNMEQALKSILKEHGIDVLSVAYRIKDFDSFWGKIERKGYEKPFQQIEDICGLRIICPYTSDLDSIAEIIKSEFDVSESVDKADLLEPDKFGYRSHHYIIRLKKSWLEAPNYRGLANLKAEIQARTILMHAWADIQHKLVYKKNDKI
jgi:putative GTP pyrophosphokinase